MACYCAPRFDTACSINWLRWSLGGWAREELLSVYRIGQADSDPAYTQTPLLGLSSKHNSLQ